MHPCSGSCTTWAASFPCAASKGTFAQFADHTEGTRSGGRLGPGEPGTALIALRTGAPVLPAAIWGTEHVKLPRDLLRRTKAHVRFGEPYRLPHPGRITGEAIAAGTDEIMRRIAELLPVEYRGEYADTGAPHATAQARS